MRSCMANGKGIVKEEGGIKGREGRKGERTTNRERMRYTECSHCVCLALNGITLLTHMLM